MEDIANHENLAPGHPAEDAAVEDGGHADEKKEDDQPPPTAKPIDDKVVASSTGIAPYQEEQSQPRDHEDINTSHFPEPSNTADVNVLGDDQALRAGIISVTFKRSSNVPFGIEFQEVVVAEKAKNEPNNKVKENVSIANADSAESAEGSGGEATSKQMLAATKSKIIFACIAEESILPPDSPIRVGDELLAVNGKTPTSIADFVMMQLYHVNNYSSNHQNVVTLTVKTPRGNPTLVQAFVVKPTPETPVGIQVVSKVNSATGRSILQVAGITGKKEPSAIGGVSKHLPSLSSRQGGTASDAPVGLLHHSVLQKGDILFSVNTTALQSLAEQQEPQSAAAQPSDSNAPTALKRDHQSDPSLRQWRPTQVVELIQQTPKFVSLVAMRPTPWHQKLTHGLRKTAIEVGGGTLAMGESLIGGGVSLLGTEASKQVLMSAKSSLQKPWETVNTWAARKKDSVVTGSREDSDDAGDAVTEMASSSGATVQQQQPTTLKTRFSHFGRSVVKPFLDHHVVPEKLSTSANATTGEESKPTSNA